MESAKNVKTNEKVRTPGMKYKHYAPSAKVVLLIPDSPTSDGKLDTFKQIFTSEIASNSDIKNVAILTTKYLDNITKTNLPIPGTHNLIIKTLGHNGEEIQANLFAALRQVDEEDKVDLIFVEGISEEDEGLAIMNRLKKAAANNCVSF